MSESTIKYELDGKVAVVRMDDGKANVFSHAALDALSAALDRAGEDEAGSVLLVGRPGKFSAGFDLSVMTAGASERRQLVEKGARLMMRVHMFRRPVVAGCTGHGLAAGAVLLTACDHRIGVAGAFKLGLNEVGIGMPLPIFAMELARERLTKGHLVAATMHGRVYDPSGARDAGFLDEVVEAEAFEATALERARALAELPDPAYWLTKKLLRGPVARDIAARLDEDMAQIG